MTDGFGIDVDAAAAMAALEAMPEAVARAMARKAAPLLSSLAAKVRGGLPVKSGALRGSIVEQVHVDGAVVHARVASLGVAYAGVQEHGFHGDEHVKGFTRHSLKAGIAQEVRPFDRTMRIRRGGAFAAGLTDMHDEIVEGLRRGVAEALE